MEERCPNCGNKPSVHDPDPLVVCPPSILQPCPNIYHIHNAHEWGEKGKIYWCEGI